MNKAIPSKKEKLIIKAGLELKEKLIDLNFAVEDFLQAISAKNEKDTSRL